MEEKVERHECLIKLTTGDQILVGVEGKEGFENLSKEIFLGEGEFFTDSEKFVVRKSCIVSVYYFPEGYANSCRGTTKA